MGNFKNDNKSQVETLNHQSDGSNVRSFNPDKLF